MISTLIGSLLTGRTAVPFLAWLLNREVTPNSPVLDRKHQTKGKYDLNHFQYDPERDSGLRKLILAQLNI